MTKAKYITIFFIIIAVLLVIPNVSNAATEYTYSDTEQGIEWSYELDENNNVIELKCETTDKTGAVTIPSTIDGKTVISLEKGDMFVGAFEDCVGITNVTIPNTITYIGGYAFKNCTGLKEITLPDSITRIENSAFNGCSGIKTITWSNNLTSIGENAFRNCSNLESLILPNSVTEIGGKAFEGCSDLKTLSLPENLAKIEEGTFADCVGLTSVALPGSVTTIEGYVGGISGSGSRGAFAGCENLEKILIPNSVASIGENVFRGCNKLTIYGNDGMESKEYAAENDIPFDYIANWDSGNSGADITGPTVEYVQVEYDSVKDYFGTNVELNKEMYTVPAGVELVINVVFDEEIEATEMPVLTIKFGNGENIQLTEGTRSGNKITYSYTIKSTDKGVMEVVDLSGGDIKDTSGNAATLTCPGLVIGSYLGIIDGTCLYANGTIVDSGNGNGDDDDGEGSDPNPDDGDDDGKGTDPNPDDDDDGKGNDPNPDTPKKDDETTAPGEVPHAGLEVGIIFIMLATVIAGIIVYARYNKMKDII